MKVLLINGSPKVKGCTYTALIEIAKELEKENIEIEIFHVGNKPIRGCVACGGCSKTKGKCVFNDDTVNIALEKANEADGFIFGSPVHYGAPSGLITSFLDRFFYAGNCFAYKPGAAIVSCRRGGATSAFDQLNKYFTDRNMPVVSSQYWNMVHGNTPEEIEQDLEGMQTMRTLGKNMAWLLKSIEAGKNAGISLPEIEPRVLTNFIR
ncbi:MULTISPECIES: flavodoxin family protein [Clostridium]|uniref:NADPH-dependent FMN reductase n=2 Tax=Clostridium TaxID=1485 RepID=A0A1S9NCW7_CLOBE|nr:flavodoxin family protein [Clostridium beijerinckii]MZK50380.1 flavodoxin family protein [Clostridium beijerinckii]MZK58463.1 flavodoxin family protein [Clostridium beijerinckii]MZK68585.1 flavodoxin family protein [Clostridium beijerinckii]MZK73953.1 flavodoxin family protein [Clostridium beijerinckii]MZK83752.1 flavodoxin family protein [Clostridium beijerinckii]